MSCCAVFWCSAVVTTRCNAHRSRPLRDFVRYAPLLFFVVSCTTQSGGGSTNTLEHARHRPPLPIDSATESLLPQGRIEQLLRQHDVAGVSYAALSSCKVTATGTAGYAEVRTKTPVNESTVFEAASLSKPVFAWLVMALVENGIVGLDQPFSETGYRYPRIVDTRRYAVLTPRLVLMHRTGLPNWAGDSGEPDRATRIEFEKEPGAAHSYSGEGYLLLQSYIEDVTRKRLEQIFQERLGLLMPNSTFKRPLPSGTEPSQGYAVVGEAGSDVAPFWRENAAFSLATTARDFAKFLGTVCRQEGLARGTYSEMLSVQAQEVEPDGQQIRWRLGWQALTINGRDAIYHTGDNGNYIALAVLFPDNGEGYVVLTNSGSGLGFSMQFLREVRAKRGDP